MIGRHVTGQFMIKLPGGDALVAHPLSQKYRTVAINTGLMTEFIQPSGDLVEELDAMPSPPRQFFFNYFFTPDFSRTGPAGKGWLETSKSVIRVPVFKNFPAGKRGIFSSAKRRDDAERDKAPAISFF